MKFVVPIHNENNGLEFEYIVLKPGEKVPVYSSEGEFKPVRLYKLPIGALEDKPSYALICETARGGEIIAQLSEEMFMKAWKHSFTPVEGKNE